jgi:hypothetical protein
MKIVIHVSIIHSLDANDIVPTIILSSELLEYLLIDGIRTEV